MDYSALEKSTLFSGVPASRLREALEANELLKINVLQNCQEDTRELADQLAQETRSDVVSVMGRKIVLYKVADKPENRKIVLREIMKARKSPKKDA